MKVTKTTINPPFVPFELKIKVETEKELDLLTTLFSYNISVPVAICNVGGDTGGMGDLMIKMYDGLIK